jgi:MFS family permease
MTHYRWLVLLRRGSAGASTCFDGLLFFNYVAPICVPDLLGLSPDAVADPEVRARVTRIVGWMTSALLVGWGTGGIVFGYLTDRLGRARTLLLTMLVYAGATAACAFATDLWVLGALRFVASLGIGVSGRPARASSPRSCRRSARSRRELLYTSAPLGLFSRPS